MVKEKLGGFLLTPSAFRSHFVFFCLWMSRVLFVCYSGQHELDPCLFFCFLFAYVFCVSGLRAIAIFGNCPLAQRHKHEMQAYHHMMHRRFQNGMIKTPKIEVEHFGGC